MKTCAYCGQGNEDGATYCCGCGTSSFRPSKPTPEPKQEKPASLPRFELRKLTDGERKQAFAVIHNTLVPEEADILVGRLVAAGIAASIADQALSQAFSGSVNTRDYIRVQVPTEEFDAACQLLAAEVQASNELAEAIASPASEKAGLPLDTSMKCLMFVLPGACLPVIIGAFVTRYYTRNGYTKRAHEAGRAFLWGLLFWIVFYLIVASARSPKR